MDTEYFMVTMAGILDAGVDDIAELGATELIARLEAGMLLIAALDDIAWGLESSPPQALKITLAARGINRLGNCFMGYSLFYGDDDAGHWVQPALT
jgi:hypothetical protein